MDSGTTAVGRIFRSMTHPLPSGEFPLEVHFDVLRRFMSVSRNGAEPVEPAAVEVQGLPPRAAQQNTAFLCDIGLLIEEKTGRFKPTPVAMQLINTQMADESRGRRLLRSLIEKTWFAATTRAFLRTGPPASLRDQDLIAALTVVAAAPNDPGEGAYRVLVEYLAYTEILDRSVRALPAEAAKASQRSSGPPGQPSTALVAPVPGPPKEKPRGKSHPSAQAVEWEEIQTSEFHLKIQSKSAAVQRLRKQLDLLEQKLHESANPPPDP